MKFNIKYNLRKVFSLVLVVLMLFTTLTINVNRVEAKEIGEKNEKACAECNAILENTAPAGYSAVLGDGDVSVFRGGNARSGLQDGPKYLDGDKNDFANPLPFGNVYIDTSKLDWTKPSNFIIDIKDDRFKWIAMDGKEYKDNTGTTTTTSDPLNSKKPLNGGTLDGESVNYSTIAYVGELKPYHTDIKDVPDSDGTTNKITPTSGGYLYRVTYLNAAILADGTRGNLVLTMREVDIETSINVSEEKPNIIRDEDGNELYRYTKAVIPIQGANTLKVAGGVTDSEGNYVNPANIVVKTKDEVEAAVTAANNANKDTVNKNPIPTSGKSNYIDDKVIRHTIGGDFTFDVEITYPDGKPASGTMAYATKDLDLPSYQNIWGRDRSDPYKYAEGLEIVKGSQSYALVPIYNHKDATTLATGWIPSGEYNILTNNFGSLDNPLDIRRVDQGSHADGIRFSSIGEKVMRDKNGGWDDVLFGGPAIDSEKPLLSQPTGTIMDFSWDNINNSRLRYKNVQDLWDSWVDKVEDGEIKPNYKKINIRRELAGKIPDGHGGTKRWDEITIQDIAKYFEGGSYSIERGDDGTFDTGFAVLLDPKLSTLRWTGSTYQSGSAVTNIFDSSLYTYVEQTRGTGGGIYLESYNISDGCKPVMNEGTVTMGRESEVTVTAVPEKGYRVNQIMIGDTHYGKTDVESLQNFTKYVIDGNDIKLGNDVVGTFKGTTDIDGFKGLKTGTVEVNGFYYDKDGTKVEKGKFIFERNADGTVDVTLPNVDNPMHVHVDFGADYYFYKVWVGTEETEELTITVAPHDFYPVKVKGLPITIGDNTEYVNFDINGHKYTATNGTYEGEVFTLTPNATIEYIDGGGNVISPSVVLDGNDFVHTTDGDKYPLIIEERIADWESSDAKEFKINDPSQDSKYTDYVTVLDRKNELSPGNRVWKVRYPSEGVSTLNWPALPVEKEPDKANHYASNHNDRNYWFAIEDALLWAAESYDNSKALVPGVLPEVEGDKDYYSNTHWGKDAVKDVEDANELVHKEYLNSNAFLSVFENGGEITNVPIVVVKGTKIWEDFDNKYNNRKDIWLHVDAQIKNSDGSKTIYNDILPAQKVAADAKGDDLTKTWGDKKAYDTGDANTIVVAKAKYIPSNAIRQENGSYMVGDTIYWINQLKKTNAEGKEYTYSIRETLDREGNEPVVKDKPDEGLLGYTSEDEDNKLVKSKTTISEKEATLYSGEVKNTLETVKYKVEKVWDDNNNQDGYRTDIKLTLYSEPELETLPNDQEKEFEIDVDATDDDLKHTWSSLPKYANGKRVIYWVVESGYDQEHYQPDMKGEEEDGNNSDVFTNIHIPETASISIFKKWDDEDNRDGLRKQLVEAVELQGKTESEPQYGGVTSQDGTPIVKGTVETEDGLVITWMNVPLKRNGEEITYKVIENIAGLTGYTTIPSENLYEFTLTNNENKEATFTNKRTPDLTEITITKQWDDMDDKFEKRPEEVTVQLVKTFMKKNDNEQEVDKMVKVNGREYVVKTSNEDIEYFAIGNKYYRSDDIDKENTEVSDYQELLPFDPDNTGKNVMIGKFIEVGEEQYPVQVTADNIEYYVIDEKYYDVDGNELTVGEDNFNPSDDDEYATKNMIVEVDGTEYEIILGNLAGEDQWYYEKDGKYYGWQGNELTKFTPKKEDATVKIKVPDKATYEEETTETENVTLKASENWTKTIKVPVNSPVLQKIAYGVDELDAPNGAPAGYMKDSVTSTEDGKFVVTNKILPPIANPDVTENWRGVKQTGTPTFKADDRTTAPDGSENKIERITLLDADGNETDTVTVPGEGTYVLTDNGDGTCSILFTPEPDFVGKTSGVKVRGYDSNDLYADTTYTPIVKMRVDYIDPMSEDPDAPVDNGETIKDKTGSDVTTTYEDKEGEESKNHPGYRFDGWDEKEVTDPETGEIKLVRTAKYTPIYNINYDPNGGTGDMPDNNYPADESSMPHDKNTFTRKGYTFEGFKAYITDPTTGKETPILDENGNPIIFKDANDMKKYFEGKPGGTSIRMEAQWKRNEYKISYDPNGGYGTMPPQHFTGDDKTAVSKPNEFKRNGHKFTGFIAVTKDGKEIGFFTDIADFIEYLHAQGDGGEVILIAQWKREENKYYIPTTGVE